jgi:hypothetical protein
MLWSDVPLPEALDPVEIAFKACEEPRAFTVPNNARPPAEAPARTMALKAAMRNLLLVRSANLCLMGAS